MIAIQNFCGWPAIRWLLFSDTAVSMPFTDRWVGQFVIRDPDDLPFLIPLGQAIVLAATETMERQSHLPPTRFGGREMRIKTAVMRGSARTSCPKAKGHGSRGARLTRPFTIALE